MKHHATANDYFNFTATWPARPTSTKYSQQLSAALAVSANDLLGGPLGSNGYLQSQRETQPQQHDE